MNIVAFSGGKDSTSLVLRMHELGEEFQCLFTPTGNELPDLNAHIALVMDRVGKKLITPPNYSLEFWMDHFNALPNWRQRWCTRLIKIVPCIAYLQAHPGSTLCVGLRADEEERMGLYGEYATYRYPLREWGWDIKDVKAYLKHLNIAVPERTDCALCYGQRLGEWYRLWKNHPEEYAKGEFWETRTGHTFRSSGRDTWPAGLVQLRTEFESGRIPLGSKVVDEDIEPCRVCRL